MNLNTSYNKFAAPQVKFAGQPAAAPNVKFAAQVNCGACHDTATFSKKAPAKVAATTAHK